MYSGVLRWIYIYIYIDILCQIWDMHALKIKHVDGDVSETFREQFILGNSYGDGGKIKNYCSTEWFNDVHFKIPCYPNSRFSIAVAQIVSGCYDVPLFFFHFNPDFRIFHRFPQQGAGPAIDLAQEAGRWRCPSALCWHRAWAMWWAARIIRYKGIKSLK